MSILIVGSVHMDYTIYMDHLPREGETVIGTDFKRSPGGKGANQAVAVARLSGKSYFASRVGADENGEILLNNLRRNNVSTEFVTVDKRTYTGIALIFTDAKGQNMIAVASGTDAKVSCRDVDKAFRGLGSVSCLLTQLEIPMKTVTYAIRKAKKSGVLTILNPAPYRPLPEDIFQYIDFITPNRVELAALAKVDTVKSLTDVEKASRKLIKKGVGAVIVTLGEEGAYIVSMSLSKKIPSFKIKVVDTVGAGDAFSGGLAYALVNGMDLKDAVRFANAAAAVSCTKYGAQASMPKLSEVRRLLKKG